MAAAISQRIDELYDQLDCLDSMVETFYERRTLAIYKPMSACLRILLTGSSGDAALVEQAPPSAVLPRLKIVPPSDAPKDHLVLPANVVIESGEAKVSMRGGCKVKNLNVAGGAVSNCRFESLFDTTAPSLPFKDWIAQPFLRQEWTVRDFIKTVANKDGGAHVDPSNSTLIAFQDWGHFHWHLTAGIASGISPAIREQLAAAHSSHVRAVR